MIENLTLYIVKFKFQNIKSKYNESICFVIIINKINFIQQLKILYKLRRRKKKMQARENAKRRKKGIHS
jgi:hypothetical protein